MKFKILSSGSPEELTRKVNEHITDGWKPVGNHSVVEIHRQNRYSGQQHMDTRIEVEYSISIVREVKLDTIEVGVYYYKDENGNKVYDIEEMERELYDKISNLVNQ